MAFRLANVANRGVLVADEHYYDIAALSGGEIDSDPMAAIAQTSALAELASSIAGATPTGALADVTLGPPVPRPQKVFGIGLNYRGHAKETGAAIPELPLVFTKFPSCLVGPTAEIELRGDRCDYEVELVVVIGKGGRDIESSAAWNHVAGFTCGQDISDRTVQRAVTPPQFNLGKSFDTFGPTGPVVVSLDQFADRADIAVQTEVNGEVRQRGRTSDMIFDVPTLIAYLSHITTLVPGDLIFTGTPSGVGVAQGLFLGDGDVITTTIEGIGVMTNRCRRAADPST